jgi:hypothetical protein
MADLRIDANMLWLYHHDSMPSVSSVKSDGTLRQD